MIQVDNAISTSSLSDIAEGQPGLGNLFQVPAAFYLKLRSGDYPINISVKNSTSRLSFGTYSLLSPNAKNVVRKPI